MIPSWNEWLDDVGNLTFEIRRIPMSEYQTFGPLFQEGQAYARKKDPDTSHESAKHTKGKLANRLESEILSALKRHPHGLTNHEIVAATGIDWNTATPRIAPLVRKGLVIDSGERRIGPTNRPGIVWKSNETRA